MSVVLKSVKTKVVEKSTFNIQDVKEDDVNIDMELNDKVRPENAINAIEDVSRCYKAVYFSQDTMCTCYHNNKAKLKWTIYNALVLFYLAYFGYAMYYKFGDEGSWRLLICTFIGVFIIIFLKIRALFKDEFTKFDKNILKPLCLSKRCRTSLILIGWCLKIGVSIFIVAYIIVNVAIDYPQNLISVAGQVMFNGLLYVCSTNPTKVKWYPVLRGFALQYIFAIIMLRWYWGYQVFKWFGDRLTEFSAYADEGAKFVFGDGFEEHFVAFKVLSVVVFFNTVISMLDNLGVMQAIISSIGSFLAFCMGTTTAESFNAAGNIFLGMTEVPLLIRPFLTDMTLSELHAVMTAGFATISGSVLGVYISFGSTIAPTTLCVILKEFKIQAKHLMSASVMSAPAALAISKLVCPETEVPKPGSKDVYKMGEGTARNIIEAASNGATSSIKLVASMAVNMLAFLCVLKFINETLTWFGDRAGVESFTLQFICSYVFFPVSFLMGTDFNDCRKVAELIGITTFTNEFIAYQSLSGIIENKKNFTNYTSYFNASGDWYWQNDNIILKNINQTLKGGVLSDKSEVIATYALCGFSNFGSIGILLGCLGALAPTRKSDLTKIVVRAMVSGSMACYLNACIAGLLYRDY